MLAAQHARAEEPPWRTHATARAAGRPEDAEIVCRAIQLILDGGLDDEKGERLAARLGVSNRQLRRLFQTHAGITPDRLAQSSRAHFARRMLNDTDLPLPDVAFVSGFGSLRQFDRTMSAIFGATPLSLRARRRRGDRVVADGGVVVRLGACTGLEWRTILAHLTTHAIAGVESIDGDTYRRTIVTERGIGALEIQCDRSGEVLLRAHLPDWHHLLHVIQRARGIFNLDVAQPEPWVRCTNRGMRLPWTWDPYELGIRAIIGQGRSARDATAIASRMVELRGQRAPGFSDWGLTHTFPSATVLARPGLDGIGLTASESATLRLFSEAVVHGDVRLDRKVPLGRIVQSLLEVPGVHPVTARYVASRIGATVF